MFQGQQKGTWFQLHEQIQYKRSFIYIINMKKILLYEPIASNLVDDELPG